MTTILATSHFDLMRVRGVTNFSDFLYNICLARFYCVSSCIESIILARVNSCLLTLVADKQ